MNTRNQPELNFDPAARPAALRRQRRFRRAHWWFQQMRQAVDQALSHRTNPLTVVEQTYLPLPGRETTCGASMTNTNSRAA